MAMIAGCGSGKPTANPAPPTAPAPATGALVEPERSVVDLRRACAGETSQSTGRACDDLITALLAQDPFGNHDEVLSMLDRVCPGTHRSCELRPSLQGTGRVPDHPFPSGGGGYAFGIHKNDIPYVCSNQGGELRGSNPLVCDAPKPDVIAGDVQSVTLLLCAGDVVCGVSLETALPVDGFFARYAAVRDKMALFFGPPTQSSARSTPSCRAPGDLARCLASGELQIYSAWDWGVTGRIAVGMSSQNGQLVLFLDYKDAQQLASRSLFRQ